MSNIPTIEEIIRVVIKHTNEFVDAAVTEDSKFIDDLALDSLDCLELLMALEEEFEVDISDDEAVKIDSVKSASTVIHTLLNK